MSQSANPSRFPIRFGICLRIHAEALDFNEISERLGRDATHSVSTRPLTEPTRSRSFYLSERHAWLLESEAEVASRDPAAHLAWLVETLAPLAPALEKLRSEADLSASIEIDVWSKRGDESLQLAPQDCAALVVLGAPVRFSFLSIGDGKSMGNARPWSTVGGEDLDRFDIGLLVYPGASHFNSVSECLGIDATSAVAVEAVDVPLKAKKAKLGKKNGWFLNSEEHVGGHQPLAHLDWFGKTLSPVAARLDQLLKAPQARSWINVVAWSKLGSANLSFEIDQPGMKDLAAMGLPIWFLFQSDCET